MGKLLKRRTIALLSAPGIAFIIICCTYPVLSIIAQTFIGAEGNLTLSGYWEIFQMSFFNNSLARTMKLSLITTFLHFPPFCRPQKYGDLPGHLSPVNLGHRSLHLLDCLAGEKGNIQ